MKEEVGIPPGKGVGETMRFPWRKIALCIFPALLAGWAVAHATTLIQWGSTHATLLPIVIVLILSALFISPLRRFLIVTFCYGIAFLSYSTYRLARPLPPGLNYEWVLTVRALLLELVMILAITAAVLEAFYPNTSAARRSYFAAVGLYFTGTGLRTYLWSHELRALFLLLTGVAALLVSLLSSDRAPSTRETHPKAARAEDAVITFKARRLKEWTEEASPHQEPSKIETT